jgi:hypothetical protein
MLRAWLTAVCWRIGARLLIASYTQHSHTITPTSTHQGERLGCRWATGATPATAAGPLVSIETALDKP